MWYLPRPEFKPLSPALHGGFLTLDHLKRNIFLKKKRNIFLNGVRYLFSVQPLLMFWKSYTWTQGKQYFSLCNPVDCSPPGSTVHGILRQEHWSGLPCPPPGIFLTQGSSPSHLRFPSWQDRFFTAGSTLEAPGKTVAPVSGYMRMVLSHMVIVWG